MNTQELRIGNLVNHDDVPVKIDGIQPHWIWFDDMSSTNMDDIEPIPLTEAWIKHLGFQNNRVSVNSVDELAYTFDGHEWSLRYQTKGSGFTRDYEIKYVHQLQNLFFCLTGKELSCG